MKIMPEKMNPAARLARIAVLLGDPCPVPDVHFGFTLCTCDSNQRWPCLHTQAVWLAKGLDPDEERDRILRNLWAVIESTGTIDINSDAYAALNSPGKWGLDDLKGERP